MSSLLRQAVLGVVVVGGALASAVSANAQESCDWYAKTALKQQQENEQKRCGFTGPNWTSDMKARLRFGLGIGLIIVLLPGLAAARRRSHSATLDGVWSGSSGTPCRSANC